MSAIDERAERIAAFAQCLLDKDVFFGEAKENLIGIRAEANAILAHPQQVAPMLGVKALKWDNREDGWYARPQSGPIYAIIQFHGGFDLLINGCYVKPYIAGFRETYTLDAAKAAAQADYEQRILSALATPEAGTSEREPVAEPNGEYISAMADIREHFGVPFAVSGIGNVSDVVEWIAAKTPAPAQAPVDGEAVLVPRELTLDMEQAFWDTHAKATEVFADVSDLWAAMLAAAPSARKEP